MMKYHAGGFIKALQQIYPNIGLEEDKFVNPPSILLLFALLSSSLLLFL